MLRLLHDGLTNTELADRLFLSVKTVNQHVSTILAKLEVNKRRDAVRKARDLGNPGGLSVRRNVAVVVVADGRTGHRHPLR